MMSFSTGLNEAIFCAQDETFSVQRVRSERHRHQRIDRVAMYAEDLHRRNYLAFATDAAVQIG